MKPEKLRNIVDHLPELGVERQVEKIPEGRSPYPAGTGTSIRHQCKAAPQKGRRDEAISDKISKKTIIVAIIFSTDIKRVMVVDTCAMKTTVRLDVVGEGCLLTTAW